MEPAEPAIGLTRDAAGAENRHRQTLRALAKVNAGSVINDKVMQARNDSLGTAP